MRVSVDISVGGWESGGGDERREVRKVEMRW